MLSSLYMKKISLLQINNAFSGQNYLPYSAALLAACFQNSSAAGGEYEFHKFIYKRARPDEIVNELCGSDVLGLSLYAWNVNLSLEVAKRYKRLNRGALVFAGGPSAPDNSEAFLRANPQIDVLLHNEGEIPFARLLEQELIERRWDSVPSASFLRDNQMIKTEMAQRITDLETISSPFLTGVIENIMDKNPNEKWIGLWETNRGCPFACTYCDWGSATGSKTISRFSMNRLEAEIEWFARKKVEFIFCCDANFGMFPRDLEIARMVGETKSRLGYPHALSVQNTKNSTERSFATQKILCDYGLNKGVTLSMQTMSDTVLGNIKRSNIRLSSYLELQYKFQQEGVPTYSDLILGLPGETFESFVDGLANLIESGQHNRIQFNNLSILPNAEMANPSYRKKYGIRTVVTDIVNMHGSLEQDEEAVREKQEIVVETLSLNREGWVRTRVCCWLVAFLYFNKVAQIPLAIANGSLGVPFKKIISRLMTPERRQFPCLAEIVDWLENKAEKILTGGPEYVHSEKWLDIYWPADEYLFIQYTLSGKLGLLVEEIGSLLTKVTIEESSEVSSFFGTDSICEILRDASTLNTVMLSKPGEGTNTDVVTEWNVGECYQARIEGRYCQVQRGKYTYRSEINYQSGRVLEDWLQEVVWYGNKRGAYINKYAEV
uniref:B12-binding domain-containing radical SAM protein n=1 Tax=Cyanobium sp. TaxID=2164130 RepID=UPI004047BB7E